MSFNIENTAGKGQIGTPGVTVVDYVSRSTLLAIANAYRTAGSVPTISSARITSVQPLSLSDLQELSTGSLALEESLIEEKLRELPSVPSEIDPSESAFTSEKSQPSDISAAAHAASPAQSLSQKSSVGTCGYLVQVRCILSQKDPDRNGGEKSTYLKHITVLGLPPSSVPGDGLEDRPMRGLRWKLIGETSLQEMPGTQVWYTESPGASYIGTIRTLKSEKGEEQQILEIFDSNRKLQSVDLSEASVPHGKVFDGDSGGLGCFEWSHSESCLLYVAEGKVEKRVSLFDSSLAQSAGAVGEEQAGRQSPSPVVGGLTGVTGASLTSGNAGSKAFGGQNLYAEDWGEALKGKRHAVLALYNMDTKKVSVLLDLRASNQHRVDQSAVIVNTVEKSSSTSSSLSSRSEIVGLEGVGPASVGHAVWAPDDSGIVFVAWSEAPFRLGLIYCHNRPSALYYYDFRTSKARRLSLASSATARNPRFSPDGRLLVWFEGTIANGPHIQCSRLVMCEWPKSATELELLLSQPEIGTSSSSTTRTSSEWPHSTIVLDIEQKPEPRAFPGLFTNADSITSRIWCVDSQHLLLDSIWHSTRELLAVDVVARVGCRVSETSSGDDGPLVPRKSDEVGVHRLLDVCGPFVLEQCSSPNVPESIRIALLPYTQEGEVEMVVETSSSATLAQSIGSSSRSARAAARRKRQSLSLGTSITEWFTVYPSSLAAAHSLPLVKRSLPFLPVPKHPYSFSDKFSWRVHKFEAEDGMPYEAVLLVPRSACSPSMASSASSEPTVKAISKVPLVLMIHGGPHSVFSTEFLQIPAAFASLNYAVLYVNYRGSIGFGEAGVESLTGAISEKDVADCVHSLDAILERHAAEIDSKRVFLYGGSHGGFLVTHLMARHSSRFVAVVARNPVIDLPSMATALTDIPDWCFTECGLRYEQGYPPQAAQLLEMHRRSPLAAIVERLMEDTGSSPKLPPLMLHLGDEDRRVPMQQGLALARLLQATNERVEVHMYPGANHSLGKVPTEADCFINAAAWFAYWATHT